MKVKMKIEKEKEHENEILVFIRKIFLPKKNTAKAASVICKPYTFSCGRIQGTACLINFSTWLKMSNTLLFAKAVKPAKKPKIFIPIAEQ